jgi:phosphoserine aminotransferase
VGPSLIPRKSVLSLVEAVPHLLGTSHRKMPVRNLVREVQEGLRNYFQLPFGYEVVLGNGGATFLWDMIGLGLVENSSFHFICGEFSDKWQRAHELIPWIKTGKMKVDYGLGINPVEQPGFDMICCTLNETSTGVQLSEIPQMKNPQTLLAIDATSGAGQVKMDFNRADLYYFSPQKVFASEGGLYVAIMSPKAMERAFRLEKEHHRFVPQSMKWSHAIENSKNNQTYNTPAVSTIFFLNEQIKILNKIGENQVILEAKRKADLVYGWAESCPYLSPFVKDSSFRSMTVATIDIDEKFNADDLVKVLREQHAAYDIEGYRKLNRNQLRISLFHNVSFEDLEKLTKIISSAIETDNSFSSI